jgi:hypothetical protein
VLFLYTAAWRVLLASTSHASIGCLDYFHLPTARCPEPVRVPFFPSRRSLLATYSSSACDDSAPTSLPW